MHILQLLVSHLLTNHNPRNKPRETRSKRSPDPFILKKKKNLSAHTHKVSRRSVRTWSGDRVHPEGRAVRGARRAHLPTRRGPKFGVQIPRADGILPGEFREHRRDPLGARSPESLWRRRRRRGVSSSGVGGGERGGSEERRDAVYAGGPLGHPTVAARCRHTSLHPGVGSRMWSIR